GVWPRLSPAPADGRSCPDGSGGVKWHIHGDDRRRADDKMPKEHVMGTLSGKVAVVTGSSRGMGKGIPLALAEQGATVYVTGRTINPGTHSLPGTIGETVAEIERRGGKGVGVEVDLGQDEQIAALFAQVKKEQRRLAILGNEAID